MAVLNGMYLHVVDESISRGVDATSHPVEEGIPITDTVRRRPLSISLSGKIVDYGSMTSEQVIAQIKSLQESGSLINYRGRNVATNMQVRSFETAHPNTNNGGADFYLDLVEVRIAKSAYTPQKVSEKEKEAEAKENPTIKVGSTVVFKGGPVYSSSDAKKAAATRGRSTCECTKISTASYSVHQYHLISKDGGKVYGWVDRSNIEGAASTSTSGKTNAGTQQTKKKQVASSTAKNVKATTNAAKKTASTDSKTKSMAQIN